VDGLVYREVLRQPVEKRPSNLDTISRCARKDRRLCARTVLRSQFPYQCEGASATEQS
jgi:hypothetical protein